MAKDDSHQEFIDGLVTFENGMDSGVLPFLLPRNKLSFGTNCAVRGGFVTHRPVFQKIALNYPSNSSIQSAVERGLWQNGVYYKPDFGSETMCAAIGGRLFQFTPLITGYASDVREVTIPGDPNPATVSLNWMWQSERWLIWNDGLNLPVIFDGTTSRRSMGSSHILATTLLAFTVPATNQTVNVTLTAPYSGPINIPVTIQGARYNIVPNPAVTNAKLTKLYDPNVTVPTDSQVIVIPSQVAVLLNNLSGLTSTTLVPVSFPSSGSGNTPFDPSSGTVTIGTDSFNVNAVVNALTWELSLTPVIPPSFPHAAGDLVTTFSTKLNVVVGQTIAPFTVPAAVGGSVNVQLDAPYTGSPQVVWIGVGEYLIEALPPALPSAVITLQNIGDSFVPVHVIAPGNQLIVLPELPAGRVGAYGMGRNAESLTDGIQFIIGDIVGGPSGTPAYNYRDAVLRVTENAYLAGGGLFHVPGTVSSIRSMTFTANLDASLGQGALQVGTPTSIFSCNTPVDRTTWATLTNPIVTESLIGFGPLGQNSTIPVNSDTLFRSIIGFGSLILGRREFYSWGNTPISNEVERIVSRDSTSLLIYSSAISFDNRLLMTCKPTPSGMGVFHPGTVALDYDPISNMQQKTPAVYDGLWTGLNVLQWVTGLFNGVQRAFAFTLNLTTGKIELYELLMTQVGKFDNGNSRITWSFESATLFKEVKGKSIFDLIRLNDGEIYVDDIVGTVDFQVFYRPDNYPCWMPWHDWSICADTPTTAVPNAQPTYRTRMGLGEPDPKPCEQVNNRPFREAYTFQFKFIITGHCRFRGAKFTATLVPQPRFARPVCKGTCEQLNTTENCEPCGLIDCINPDDFGTYVVQNNLNPVQPSGTPFFNEPVFFPHACTGCGVLAYTGTGVNALPSWISVDVANSQLVGAAGAFQGFSQTDANQIAQAQLNAFGTAALLAGTLTCVPPAICASGMNITLLQNIYQIVGYFDGYIPNPNNPNGNPAWDGSFPTQDGARWWAGEGGQYTIEGKSFCNATLEFLGCVNGDPQWSITVGIETGDFWVGLKVCGDTPEGVYNLTSGADVLPTQITIVLKLGTTTVVGNAGCAS